MWQNADLASVLILVGLSLAAGLKALDVLRSLGKTYVRMDTISLPSTKKWPTFGLKLGAKMQVVYKIYAANTSSTDAAASVDMPDGGIIEGILLDHTVQGANALDEGAAWEISFASTSGFTSNDTRASLAGLADYQEFLTSGGAHVGKTMFVPMEVTVAPGERIYAHTLVAGTVTLNVLRAWLYVRTGGGTPRRPNFR